MNTVWHRLVCAFKGIIPPPALRGGVGLVLCFLMILAGSPRIPAVASENPPSLSAPSDPTPPPAHDAAEGPPAALTPPSPDSEPKNLQTHGAASPSTTATIPAERSRQIAIALMLLILITLIGLALVGFTLFWGMRTRRIARQPLPEAPRGDPFWHLRHPLSPEESGGPNEGPPPEKSAEPPVRPPPPNTPPAAGAP